MSCAVTALTTVVELLWLTPLKYFRVWIEFLLISVRFKGFLSLLVKMSCSQVHLHVHRVHTVDVMQCSRIMRWLLESSCCIIIIIVIVIIIISALESISQVRQSAFWGEYKSNWIKWNQMKHWFFWWGENRSTGENLLKHSRKRGNSTHLQCWVWNLEHRFEWWIRTSPTLFPVPWLCFWCDLVT